MALAKYDHYKDSGVEWLGEIPLEWKIKKFKYVALTSKGKLPKKLVSDETGRLPPYLTMDFLRGNQAEQFVADKDAFVVHNGDTLLLWDGSNAGEILNAKYGVVSSTIAQVIFFDNIDKKYAWYYVKFLERYIRNTAIGMGIPHVSADELNNLTFCIPPEVEQKFISAFLDQKTAEIDQAIAKKQRLIELLKEQKAILINRAVTQGLNPDVPMKDSGVEWIGEIPEHWQVKKLKFLVKFYSGATPSKDNLGFWGGEISWVSPKDMKKKYIANSIDSITEQAVKKTGIRLLPISTVLIVVRGMILAKKIPVAITTSELTINQDMKGLITNSACNPEYLMYLLDGLHEELSTILEESGHGTKTMPTDQLANFELQLPPLGEQQSIISTIKAFEKSFELMIEKTNLIISALIKFKQTLIAHAVTGKIKV